MFSDSFEILIERREKVYIFCPFEVNKDIQSNFVLPNCLFCDASDELLEDQNDPYHDAIGQLTVGSNDKSSVTKQASMKALADNIFGRMRVIFLEHFILDAFLMI